MTIIVADDSLQIEKISKPNVKHYLMPYTSGYFAGRNLALSQVQTEFVLYVDDDFIFTNETVLEKMVDKLENYRITLVAEAVHNGVIIAGRANMIEIGYSKKGMCYRHKQIDITHPYLPHCWWTELSLNFFMARTKTLQRIGFDQNIVTSTRGHAEFWIDALGKSNSIFCNDVTVNHDSKSVANAVYTKARSNLRHYLLREILFKKNFCDILLR
ncbi:beta-1,4 N-acetylgalactosaminyltransferase 1-like [Saccoglossus kowalevskii]|uniref:Beta-1,4 N-acetylgalactosaminyltransferase 1-like n=1 Tax=Saccoglossus kowalevskii TaxID=10224 RepID=A0ABM0LWF8_SACKO|nr:PREDICTED: beta-1,4 N-acetylgalactosaminyltransferase 1-like [Saccoglossus kowalevskii]